MGMHKRASRKAARRVSLGLVTGGIAALTLTLGGVGAQAAAAATHGGTHAVAARGVSDGNCRPWMWDCGA